MPATMMTVIPEAHREQMNIQYATALPGVLKLAEIVREGCHSHSTITHHKTY